MTKKTVALVEDETGTAVEPVTSGNTNHARFHNFMKNRKKNNTKMINSIGESKTQRKKKINILIELKNCLDGEHSRCEKVLHPTLQSCLNKLNEASSDNTTGAGETNDSLKKKKTMDSVMSEIDKCNKKMDCLTRIINHIYNYITVQMKKEDKVMTAMSSIEQSVSQFVDETLELLNETISKSKEASSGGTKITEMESDFTGQTNASILAAAVGGGVIPPVDTITPDNKEKSQAGDKKPLVVINSMFMLHRNNRHVHPSTLFKKKTSKSKSTGSGGHKKDNLTTSVVQNPVEAP